ncbi:MAG: hypothetical protein JNJ73_01210 [Hyphomonadaceae bacterium]|nr:hypothetical protein [Hyphomonadaceae bacterium]
MPADRFPERVERFADDEAALSGAAGRTPLGAAVALSAALALTACGEEGPPSELAGLWSSGPAACEAGIGVRFKPEAVAAHYSVGDEALLQDPIYQIERRGAHVRVRIVYSLPTQTGGAHSPGARGILVVERGGDGWLNAVSHRLEDRRTGSARLVIANDPVATAFHLRKCGAGAWIEGLRGRAGA